MPVIKGATIERLRRIPITEILDAESIPYKRIGREAVTLCPWHNDSNPSLTVNDDKNICFCFACGGGSDGIAYVQQKFGLGFADAVIRVAEKHKILVEYDDLDTEEALSLARKRRAAIDRISSEQESYKNGIRGIGGENARTWLTARGIKPESSREFGIGWSNSGYFAGRVTIPIHNHRGTIVGFTGRIISDLTSDAKYKNSSSSDLFDKKSVLFNEHRALQYARLNGYMVFVEGHFDVISMWQYGIKNVVATQGTSGPPLDALRRFMRQCRKFVLLYDSDSGGQKAIEHFIAVAGPLACSGEVNITIAKLPNAKDPDEYIRSGGDLYAVIESAPQWLDWQIDCWLAGIDRSDTHRFSQIETAIRQLVESIKSPALRQYYVDKTAKVLAADAKSAVKLAQTWNKSLPKLKQSNRWTRPAPEWIRNQAERRALRSYIHFPNKRSLLRKLMEHIQSPSHLWLWNRIVELESCCESFTPETIMTILVVSEPQYTRMLRPLVMPTIKLTVEDGMMEHIERVLLSGTQTVGKH